MRHCFKHLEVQLELGSDLDERALVFCRIAILGRREDGDTPTVMLHFVALHADLVRTNDRLQPVLLTEPLGDIRAELKTNATFAGPTARLRLRIGPEHLHHQTLLSGLPLVVAIQLPDIIQCRVIVGEETTMEHQVFVADQRRQRQGREGLGEHLEHCLVVLCPALALETVHLVHVIRLVVAAVEEDAVRPQPFVRVEQERNLRGPRATVHKVTIEEVGVCIGGVSVQTEDLQQVEELAYIISIQPRT